MPSCSAPLLGRGAGGGVCGRGRRGILQRGSMCGGLEGEGGRRRGSRGDVWGPVAFAGAKKGGNEGFLKGSKACDGPPRAADDGSHIPPNRPQQSPDKPRVFAAIPGLGGPQNGRRFITFMNSPPLPRLAGSDNGAKRRAGAQVWHAWMLEGPRKYRRPPPLSISPPPLPLPTSLPLLASPASVPSPGFPPPKESQQEGRRESFRPRIHSHH